MGGCWSRNCFAHFSTHSFHCIYYDQYEKIWITNQNIFFPTQMVAIFDFRALTTKVHNFKTVSPNAVKSCTHIEDIEMKTFSRVYLVLLNITFLIIFCVKNNKLTTFQIFFIKKYSGCFKKFHFVRF